MVGHLFSLIKVYENWERDISAPGSHILDSVELDMFQNGDHEEGYELFVRLMNDPMSATSLFILSTFQ